MKRFMRSRRAVSPVLAAVLMMLVVMTGMSLLFAFFVNYAGDFQRGTGSAVLESLTVEDVWFKSATHLEVWVYNFGKVPLNITSVYIDNRLVTPLGYNLGVPVGGHGNITLGLPFSLASGIHNYKIVTSRGTGFEGACLRP